MAGVAVARDGEEEEVVTGSRYCQEAFPYDRRLDKVGV